GCCITSRRGRDARRLRPGTPRGGHHVRPPRLDVHPTLGINNLGQVAGSYTDGTGQGHGFVRDAGGAITTLDPSGATRTGANGIKKRATRPALPPQWGPFPTPTVAVTMFAAVSRSPTRYCYESSRR